MEIFQQFGVEWKLLLTQAVNFLLFLLIFWRFAYRPLQRMLDKRQRRVANSLQEAERVRQEAERLDAKQAKDIERTKKRAAQIIAEAKEAAQTESQAVMAEAKQAAENITASQREQLATEQQRLREELQSELATLAAASTRRVLSNMVTDDDRTKMVAAATAELKSSAGNGRSRRGR